MLVGVYVLTNVGIPVYYHYCGGELESVSTLVKAQGCCGDEEEEEDSDCCQNEVKIIAQFNDSYSKTENIEIASPFKVLCDNSFFHTTILPTTNLNSHLSKFLPLKLPEPGRAILHQKSVLII